MTRARCDINDAQLSQLELGDVQDLEARAQLEQHIDTCDACQARLAEFAALTALARTSPPPGLPPALAESMLASILEGARDAPEPEPQPAELPEILTMSEVAELLRVNVEALDEELDTLPVFTFAGRLRIRRARLMEWIEARERRTEHRRALALVPKG